MQSVSSGKFVDERLEEEEERGIFRASFTYFKNKINTFIKQTNDGHKILKEDLFG